MEFLIRQPVHATADQIHRALNRTDPRASRATVYNSLRVLIEAGLVREVMLEGAAARFDAKVHRHHHFICDRCGGVEDVQWWENEIRLRGQTGENYFPKNVYPTDYPGLQEQVQPLQTYPVELRDSEVWVDLG